MALVVDAVEGFWPGEGDEEDVVCWEGEFGEGGFGRGGLELSHRVDRC